MGLTRGLTWALGFLAGAAAMYFSIDGTPPPKGRRQGVDSTERRDDGRVAAASQRSPVGSTPPASSLPASPREQALTLDEPLEGTIVFGLVSTPRGEPIPQARLTLSAPGAQARESYVNTSGYFTLAGVSPGAWTVRARAEGHTEVSMPLEVTESQRFRRVDVTLVPTVKIAIRFVDTDGRRLEDVLRESKLKMGLFGEVYPYAVATKDAPLEQFAVVPYRMAVLSRESNFTDRSQLRNATPRRNDVEEIDGELEVQLGFPVHVTAAVRSLVFDRKLLTEPLPRLDLVVDSKKLLGSLAGLRVDVVNGATGEAIAGAKLHLGDRQGGGSTLTSGADGRAAFSNLVPGLLVLEVSASKELGQSQEYVRLMPGETAAVRVELGETARLTGVITDPDGLPVKGQFGVQAVPEPKGELSTPLDLGPVLLVDSNGKFVGIFSRRPYLLTTWVPGFAKATHRVDLTNGPVDDVRITLVKGTSVTLRLRGPVHARPLVVVRGPDGLPVWSAFAAPGDTALTLAPGAYRLEVQDSAGTRRTDFRVADSPIEVTMDF